MFEWKVEDMILLNQKGGIFIGTDKIYDCENKTSREDKIAFVDSLQDGKLTYILSLVEKFEKESESMPRNQWGSIKTVSLKAWIKRNDDRKILDDLYKYGNIRFLGGRNIECISLRGDYDTHKDYVDEVFHRQLKECEKMEYKYFLEHDEYSILKQKFRDRNYHTTFGVNIAECSDGKIYICKDKDDFYDSEHREITIEELKEILAKFEQVDALVKKITAETHIVY